MLDESHTIRLMVNGQAVVRAVEPRTLLAQFLRESLDLTGTHIGCDTSQCGACTVIIDGLAVKSCTILAVQADGSTITTVEGLKSDGQLHPVQEAFRLEHGLQCGFCTPGAMMLSSWIIQQNPHPDSEAVRESLDGLICRCTGYENIVRSVIKAAEIQEERSLSVGAHAGEVSS